MELGIRIKQLRNRKKIKQYELAKMVGVSKSYLCDIESGKSMPSLKVLYTIAESLSVDISELFISEEKEV